MLAEAADELPEYGSKENEGEPNGENIDVAPKSSLKGERSELDEEELDEEGDEAEALEDGEKPR